MPLPNCRMRRQPNHAAVCFCDCVNCHGLVNVGRFE
jgi:hypothetical protein